MKIIILLGSILFMVLSANAKVPESKTIEGTSHVSPNHTKFLKKAQRIFRKKLQKRCGYNAAYFAQLHTQDEWEDFDTLNQFKKEFARLCPKGKSYLKDKWVKPLYIWSKEYAKDSLYRPLC